MAPLAKTPCGKSLFFTWRAEGNDIKLRRKGLYSSLANTHTRMKEIFIKQRYFGASFVWFLKAVNVIECTFYRVSSTTFMFWGAKYEIKYKLNGPFLQSRNWEGTLGNEFGTGDYSALQFRARKGVHFLSTGKLNLKAYSFSSWFWEKPKKCVGWHDGTMQTKKKYISKDDSNIGRACWSSVNTRSQFKLRVTKCSRSKWGSTYSNDF